MPRYSSIITDLIARITAHNVTSGILEGWKFVSNPVADPEGQKDLPIIRLFMPDITEKAHEQIAIVANGLMKLTLTVSTRRTLGLADHINGVEKVMDAIELTGTTIDLLLNARLAKPMEFSTSDQFITDMALTSQITVNVVPKACRSGGRRS